MTDPAPLPPDVLASPTDVPPLPPGEPGSLPAQASRHDANLRLIHRRLEDERRMAKARRWWLPGF